ncbi:GNAT family N-acetyltransferase [Hymenobacter fodinae]|uniref:GNAT family N-acetyltransferase n=1 Tax=Hymenobacter fodinae TaxID=2510796 RepID=UPI001FD98021|nr:GNAT family N-acetyltransferase [Hymenobacter fodinae]
MHTQPLLFREAQVADIPQMSTVRLSVQENRLSDPARVTAQDYLEYLTQRGKGWVCEAEGIIVGFGIADVVGHSIWALFVQPEFAGLGIGKRLHELMLQWYFAKPPKPSGSAQPPAPAPKNSTAAKAGKTPAGPKAEKYALK